MLSSRRSSSEMVSPFGRPAPGWSRPVTASSARSSSPTSPSFWSAPTASLFVRFGIDTEVLKGEGFLRVAREGEAVRKGDVIIKLDLPLLTQKAPSILSPIIVSNMDQITELTKHTGPVTEGETVVLSIKV